MLIPSKLKLVLGVWMVYWSLATFGQNASLTGKVTLDNQPVQFARVFLKSTQLGAFTDEQGDFRIANIPLGDYTVVILADGCETQENRVDLRTAGEHPISFQLLGRVATYDEVVVSGTMKEVSKMESPVSIEVYSAKFFKANPNASLFESLQNINGVKPQLNCNVCNTGDIHINGLEGPYTMVLIDGMPIVSGLSTVYGLTGIPQALIDRVEVVKGPASTLYGSEAVGGLLNIITKKPGKTPIFSSDVFATTWGEMNADIGTKMRVSNKVEALLGLNYFNYQNPVDNNFDGFTDITLQNRISVFNKFNFTRKEGRRFSIAGRYIYEDRWGGEMNWNPNFRGGDSIYGESIYTSRWELFGVYDLPIRERVSIQLSANGHDQNSVYGNTKYLANQYIGFGQATWNKTLGKQDWMLGIAYRYTYYDDNTPATEQGDSISSSNLPSQTHLPGLFVQNEITFSPKHKVLAGIRYDYNSIHGSILTPRINYKWTSDNRKSIVRLGLGNGYRVANVFTEDHAALTGARTIVFLEELKPERSWNVNVNFDQKLYLKNGGVVGFNLGAFYTYFTNRILPDYDTDPNQIIYGNLSGNSVSQGLSMNIDAVLKNGFKVLLGSTLMDVSITEAGITTRQVLTERFSGVWTLGYTFKNLGLSLDYTGNAYSPMRLPILGPLDDRPEYSPWWSVQNIQLTKTLNKGWELYGGVKNLLNYTPPANSIARAFDPFDQGVAFDAQGQVIPTATNPNALTFDPSYVFAPNQGIRGFLGFRYTLP